MLRIEPAVWGPFFWNTIHIIALGYPNEPTYSDKKAAKEFFESLVRLIPCAICREHYTANLKEMPITASLDRRRDLLSWTIKFHNKVNVMLNKPEKTETEVLAYYAALGQRGRSPVWNSDDLSELNMRSFLRGVATTVGIGMLAGGALYYLKA